MIVLLKLYTPTTFFLVKLTEVIRGLRTSSLKSQPPLPFLKDTLNFYSFSSSLSQGNKFETPVVYAKVTFTDHFCHLDIKIRNLKESGPCIQQQQSGLGMLTDDEVKAWRLSLLELLVSFLHEASSRLAWLCWSIVTMVETIFKVVCYPKIW